MLKAQHPDWEVYMTGIHGRKGRFLRRLPYAIPQRRGQKFTDHHIQSPLNNVEASCAVCHREKTVALIKDVYDRQTRSSKTATNSKNYWSGAHLEATKAWELGATEEEMKPVLMDIRHAQWRGIMLQPATALHSMHRLKSAGS